MVVDMDRAVVSWSGGKDAAYAFYALRDTDVEVVSLMTTINAEHDRSTMHGVRRALYDRQAVEVGVPIDYVRLPPEPSNEVYEEIMAGAMSRYRDRGIDRVVFADIFLDDVRAYREERLAAAGVTGCWPLWGRNTTDLIEDILDAGFTATVVAVDGDVLDASYAGRELDRDFLDALPAGVDPCGENGEFHTFVWDGPLFDAPLPVETGETVTRAVGDTEIHYCDLLVAADE